MTATPVSAELLALADEAERCLDVSGGNAEYLRSLLRKCIPILRLAAKPAEEVREATIEECQGLCNGLRHRDYSAETPDWISGTFDCAKAIRALSTTGAPKP